jgi:hypothetical protein
LLLGAKTTKDNVPFSNVVSQELVTDISVLGARVMNRVVSNFYGTLIVTKEGNPIWNHTIIKEALLHIEDLSTTSPRGNVFRLCGG